MLRTGPAAVTAPAALLGALLGALLAACGGGGGGGPAPAGAGLRLQMAGAALPPGAAVAHLAVSLPELPQLPGGAVPALLEFDLSIDPPLAEVATAAPALVAVQPRPTVDGDRGTAGFHVIYGDGENATAAPIAPGELLRIAVQPAIPRQAGTATAAITGLRAVDAAGRPLAVSAVPVTAPVRVE